MFKKILSKHHLGSYSSDKSKSLKGGNMFLFFLIVVFFFRAGVLMRKIKEKL